MSNRFRGQFPWANMDPSVGLGHDLAFLGYISEIMSILGTTTPSLWPGFDSTGQVVHGYAATDLVPRDEATALNIQDEWLPKALRADQLFMYHNVQSTNNHFSAGDDASYSFGDGSVDSPMSMGIWVIPEDITTVALIAKYDSVGGVEEYAFRIDANSFPALELHDASASASEIGTSVVALSLYRPYFLVVTYDGNEAAPVMRFYINGESDGGTGATTETGAYVAMESTAAPLLIAASGVTAAPTEEYDGYMAMPFLTGKELSATEVRRLYELTRVLVGA